MIIEQINNEKNGYFRAIVNETEAGRMAYTWASASQFIINHTQVYPGFRGMNVGKQLVLEAVNFARENNMKIIPECFFAKSIFKKSGSIRDVLVQ